jgi:hypothetical protein
MNADETVKVLRCHASQTSGVRGNCKDCPANRGDHELCAYNETLVNAADLIESLTAQLAESQRREKTAVSDLRYCMVYLGKIHGHWPCFVCSKDRKCVSCNPIWRGVGEGEKV